MLEVQKIIKNYQNKPLLRGINFSVCKGEVVCLLGPSGSGKSTLLRIIAGLEPAESGEILWDGRNINNVPTYKRSFGLMFQDYALFPHKNVQENVAFGLKMQRLPAQKIEKYVNRALVQVNLLSFRSRRVTDLSGGEQQRVALARALAARPKMIMLDEPLGALDRNLREQLIEELHELLHTICIPTIYVTHDQDEAFAMGDRILLLHDGKIIQEGTPEEVYQHPASQWVAQFLGLVNLVSGTVEKAKPFQVTSDMGLFEINDQKQTPKVGAKVTLLFKPDAAIPVKGSMDVNCLRVKVTDSLFRGTGYLVRFSSGHRRKLEFILEKSYHRGEEIILSINPKKIFCLS
jgi:spermidine/putrescine transport system ATP-binding protein